MIQYNRDIYKMLREKSSVPDNGRLFKPIPSPPMKNVR